MLRWARPPLSRDQIVLFSPTLDSTIAADHPVRLFDETLRKIDFSAWEQQYVLCEGQPPIHPRVMAGVILYGLSVGIRASRKLEYATVNHFDVVWLCEGRQIDHATLAGFRTRFQTELKDLFRRIGRVAIEMGMVNLNQIALDGTAVRACNSRYATARRASLEQKLAGLDEQVQKLLAEAQQADEADRSLYGESSPTKLPRELSDLKDRQARLRRAMEHLEQIEKKREGRKDANTRGPAVPVTDPDSAVLPNKAGGHAPNYTVVAATDGQSGIILDSQVLGGNDEPGTVLPAVKNVEACFGQKPQEVMADSKFNSGPNLAALAQQQIQPLMPKPQEPAGESAQRPDPTQPLPAEHRAKLPISPQRKVLDKSAFIFDAGKDCYFCPMGRTLPFVGTTTYCRRAGDGVYRVYECADCQGCELSSRCISGKSGVRRVVRDEYEPLREEMAGRMGSEEGKAKYRRRSFLCETTFAVWRTTMNFRQLLLRGMEKVMTEVNWVCSAYNLRKIVAELQRRRSAAPAAGVGA